MAQQGLTAHKENKTDKTGREVEVAGVEGEEEKEDEGNKEGNGDLDGHMNSNVDMNSYEVEENGDLYGHMNSYIDMNAYMSVEVDPSERDIVWRSGWRSRPPIERVGNSSEETRWEAETGQLTANESTTIGPSEPVHDSITPSPSERDDPTTLSLLEPVHLTR
jgi:hypothetical protein